MAEPFLQDSGLYIPDIVVDTYRDVYANVSGYLNDQLNELIADTLPPELAPALQGIVANATGILGFPAPGELARQLEEELGSLPQNDITESVPSATLSGIERELHRTMLYQQVETVLGIDGQGLTRDKVNAVGSMVQQNAQLAAAAQGAVSTQEAIKAIAQQEAQNSALLSTLHTELLQNRQDTAAQSLALMSVSESLDQQLSNKQLERRGEVFTSLQQAALARLF